MAATDFLELVEELKKRDETVRVLLPALGVVPAKIERVVADYVRLKVSLVDKTGRKITRRIHAHSSSLMIMT